MLMVVYSFTQAVLEAVYTQAGLPGIAWAAQGFSYATFACVSALSLYVGWNLVKAVGKFCYYGTKYALSQSDQKLFEIQQQKDCEQINQLCNELSLSSKLLGKIKKLQQKCRKPEFGEWGESTKTPTQDPLVCNKTLLHALNHCKTDPNDANTRALEQAVTRLGRQSVK